MSVDEIRASLFLNQIKEIGPARYQGLINFFGSAKAAIQAGIKGWSKIPLFDSRTLQSIEFALPKAKKSAEEDLELVEKNNIRLYVWQTGAYPALLKEISYPPPVLYVKGNDIDCARLAIALVGSRCCTYYGEKMALKIAAELAAMNIITVSGLAIGIDTHVHRSTINANGTTWAVIGSGLSCIYPPQNIELARKIEQQGAIISEFPMKTRPFPGHFPRRNRIIAGLSRGTVVIEGGEKSGSLITARLAAEEGRDVFAVPGPVTSKLSVAPNRLLQSGAAMVQSAMDITAELGIPIKRIPSPDSQEDSEHKLPETFQNLLSFLGEEPIQKELLAQRLNKEPTQLSSLLLEMELRGLIRSVPGGGVLKT